MGHHWLCLKQNVRKDFKNDLKQEKPVWSSVLTTFVFDKRKDEHDCGHNDNCLNYSKNKYDSNVSLCMVLNISSWKYSIISYVWIISVRGCWYGRQDGTFAGTGH